MTQVTESDRDWLIKAYIPTLESWWSHRIGDVYVPYRELLHDAHSPPPERAIGHAWLDDDQQTALRSALNLANMNVRLLFDGGTSLRPDIVEAHKSLFYKMDWPFDTPLGECRQIWVQLNDQMLAEPDHLPGMIEEWQEECKQLLREVPPQDRHEESFIRQVALMHGRFEKIHPFPDGNGRLGRWLAFAMLRWPMGLSEFLAARRPDYFNALYHFNTEPDLLQELFLWAHDASTKTLNYRLSNSVSIPDSDVWTMVYETVLQVPGIVLPVGARYDMELLLDWVPGEPAIADL